MQTKVTLPLGCPSSTLLPCLLAAPAIGGQQLHHHVPPDNKHPQFYTTQTSSETWERKCNMRAFIYLWLLWRLSVVASQVWSGYQRSARGDKLLAVLAPDADG